MNFKDIGIIIAKKPLKESSKLITLFTKNHGLYTGVIRESSKKSTSAYSEGNLVDFFWNARLHEHLGTARCELIKSYSSLLITDKTKLYAFNSIISIIKLAFHERESHNGFFPIFEKYLSSLVKEFRLKEYIHLELQILNETGYSLQLDSCAVTNERENLLYVSPKSGKAVSAKAGLQYADKLLPLPQFLIIDNTTITHSQIQQAFDLTSYFFNRYLLHNRQMPNPRKIFIEHVLTKISL